MINEQDYANQYNDIEIIVESLNTDNGEELIINILRMHIEYMNYDKDRIVGDINVFKVVFNHAINEFIFQNRLIPQNKIDCSNSIPKKLKLIINEIPFKDYDLKGIKNTNSEILGLLVYKPGY